MKLDDDTAAYLKLINSAPQLGSLSVEEARAASANAPKPPADAVLRVENHSVPGPAGDIPVRLYANTRDRDLGVVVFFHGGGWVLSSIDGHDSLCRRLATLTNCLIVSVEYRLAPEHKFPAAHDDCWAVTAWLVDNASQFGGDGSRIAVAGDSAGGNLAATVAIRARDNGVELRHQVLMYPVTDTDFTRKSYMDNGNGYFLETTGMKWFWDLYVLPEDRGNPYAVPMKISDLHGVCSATIQTAAFDPLRDEGEGFGHRLRAAGVPVDVVRYDGVIHGFMNRWHAMARGEVALEEAGRAITKALTK